MFALEVCSPPKSLFDLLGCGTPPAATGARKISFRAPFLSNVIY